MSPRSSSVRTRRKQADGDSATRFASEMFESRAFCCNSSRIFASAAVRASSGMKLRPQCEMNTIIANHRPRSLQVATKCLNNRDRIVPVESLTRSRCRGRFVSVRKAHSGPLYNPQRLETLRALEQNVLWLSSWIVHHANHIRPNPDGLKVGGHQASSASVVTLMSALYFDVLRAEDRIAVKPHASPVYHAIQYLLGRQS